MLEHGSRVCSHSDTRVSRSSQRCSVEVRSGPDKFLNTTLSNWFLCGLCFVHWGSIIMLVQKKSLSQTIATNLVTVMFNIKIYLHWNKNS